MPNFINMYFGLCIVAWIIDVISFVLIVTVKPLRKWIWRKACEWSQELVSFYESFFDD